MEDTKQKKIYRNIAVSCKAKDMLDKIAEVAAINRGAFVENLIKKEYDKIVKN